MAFDADREARIARIKFGMQLANRRFYEQRAFNNETVIISVNGEIKEVSAKEILLQRDLEEMQEFVNEELRKAALKDSAV